MQRKEFIELASKSFIGFGLLQQKFPKPVNVIKEITLSEENNSIGFEQLLYQMINRDFLSYFPSVSWKSFQVGALKIEKRSAPDYISNKEIGNFVRIERIGDRKVWVLMEHFGPGVIVRMWAPNMAKDAVMRIYLDDSKVPAIEVNMMKFFYGQDFVEPPFAEITARGGNIYLPIPFSKSCKVTIDKNDCGWAEPSDLFYIIQYKSYPLNTRIKTFNIHEYLSNKTILEQTKHILEDQNSKNIDYENVFQGRIGSKTSKVIELKTGNNALDYLSVEINSEEAKHFLRSIILKINFDNKEAVKCPIGDFFGCGSELNPYNDWMRRVEKNGKMICQWIMPYHSNAYLTIENIGNQEIAATIDLRYKRYYWKNSSLYFHCNWGYKENIPDLPVKNFNYITIKGKGLYVGDTLSLKNHSEKWWGEGPEKIKIDDSNLPLFGTGTEDYYGYAWGDPSFFNSPFHAQPKRPEGPGFLGTTVNTRIRSLDALLFFKSFKLDMEILTQDAMAKKIASLDYGVATYWYGTYDSVGTCLGTSNI